MLRQEATRLQSALEGFEMARAQYTANRRKVRSELGEQADALKSLLTRARTSLNGTGSFKTGQLEKKHKK